MTDDSARRFAWIVGPDEGGVRLDRFLVGREVLGTRSQIQQLIAHALVTVDRRAVKAGTVVRPGQTIEVERPSPQLPTVVAEPISLVVLYEDASILVIDKPPGLVVHPAPGNWQGTVVNALMHRWRDAHVDMDVSRLGLVHRLDKDTSGVLVIAKDTASLENLSAQFRRREVRKEYLALVVGTPRQRVGVVSGAIARHPVHRKQMAVRAHGRAAVTRYELVEQLGAASLLRCVPETGRTHQIRVHLAAMGHPILADRQYGGSRARTAVIQRQALHAASIVFHHPAHGRILRVNAPLPADFLDALEALRSTNRA